MGLQAKYVQKIGRSRCASVEHEARLVAYHVAKKRSGKFKKDSSRNEFGGPNRGTYAKYLHIVHLWFNFCLTMGMFTARWELVSSMTEELWMAVAHHFFQYTDRSRQGLQISTLNCYLHMLAHMLIFMGGVGVVAYERMHVNHFAIIERTITKFGEMYPHSRCRRNTKSAWDALLVDVALQLLLLWDVHGHCNLSNPAWPAFARITISMFNYLGWRLMSLTHRNGEATCSRWGKQPVLGFGDCTMQWQDGCLFAVQVAGKRVKFNSDPMYESDETGALRNRKLMVSKLTYSADVATCPCLAYLVWAVACGAFGYAPLVVVGGAYVVAGSSSRLRSCADMTCADVDALVASIFAVRPSCVPLSSQDLPVFTGKLFGGAYSRYTEVLSRAVKVVGIRMGLNPRKCSAISGRKTVGTAVVNHPEAIDVDCTVALGHSNPRLTTQAIYADATRRNADSTALVRGLPVWDMPGSVELAHTRNLYPDIEAAQLKGSAAAGAVSSSARLRNSPVKSYVVLNAYNRAFQAEMQRQFDLQARLPKAGNTTEFMRSWFFQPLDCSSLNQQQFVAWQVKKALGLLGAIV